MDERMLSSKEGGIGFLTINNPDRRNAVSAEMGIRGAEILAQLTANPAIRVIAIASTGEKVWSAGADINDFNEDRSSQARAGLSFYESVYQCPKPVVALIQGHCFGGAVALACACDLRIAASEAAFAVTAGRIGIGYPAMFTRWIIDTIGAANAAEMLFTARRYAADDALRIGLVNRTSAASTFRQDAIAYLAGIAENAPLSLHAAKTIIREIGKGPAFDPDKCQEVLEACRLSEDHAEGRRAFAEKRRPAFAGR